MLVGLFGLIKPSFIASKVVEIAGVTSIMNSRTVTDGMAKYVLVVMSILLVSSMITFVGVLLMKNKKMLGFYIYISTQIIVAALLMYCGYNIYAGLQYLSLFCFVGILMYVWNWEFFSKSKA